MPAGTDERREGRVRAVHAQARPTLALAGAFAVAAAVAGVVPHRTGAWLPLHLLLAGTVVSAISATTQLFVVTWSAAPPPARALVRWQRWLLGLGVAVLAAGRELAWPTLVLGAAGAAVTTSLVLLAWILTSTVRAGTVRRYDVPTAGYVAACAAGVVGSALGAAMVTGGAAVRSAHVAANLLGLVGLTIVATLPTFVAQTARMRTAVALDPARHARVLGVAGAGVGLAVAGLLGDADPVAGLGLATWGAALLATVPLLPRPGAKQLRWAGPRLVGVAASLAWSVGAVVVATVRVLGGADPWSPSVLAALAVGGFAQLVWSALAYVVPVLAAGGADALARSFATSRSWPGLAAANVCPALLVIGATGLAAPVALAWAADTAVRLGRIHRSRRTHS